MTFLEQSCETAYIHACELVGPNAIGFESIRERILDELLEPICGECPHMECDRCPLDQCEQSQRREEQHYLENDANWR